MLCEGANIAFRLDGSVSPGLESIRLALEVGARHVEFRRLRDMIRKYCASLMTHVLSFASQSAVSIAQSPVSAQPTKRGYILQDAAVPRSVRHQRAVLASAPRSLAAQAVRQIAATVSALMEAEGRSPSAGTGQRSMSGRA